MPLRAVMRYFLNNERLVQRIAESYPMRRAAQLTIKYFYHGREKLADISPGLLARIRSILITFRKELKDGIEDAKKQIKK